MKRSLLFTIIVSSVVAQTPLEVAAWEIAQTETSFSGFAVRNGIRAAFLEFLSNDCVMFNPLPVNGKELYRKSPERNTILSWKPARIEIAASGDFGTSTGPWEIRTRSHSTEPDGVGHFFSVWERMKHGDWKVTLDIGIGYPVGKKREEKIEIRTPHSGRFHREGDESAKASVRVAEARFQKMTERHSFLLAFDRCASQSVRVYRKGEFPVDGKAEGKKLISTSGERYSFFPQSVRVASSGDLGYSYGFAVTPQSDTSIYVRVWRKEDCWKIGIDIVTSSR